MSNGMKSLLLMLLLTTDATDATDAATLNLFSSCTNILIQARRLPCRATAGVPDNEVGALDTCNLSLLLPTELAILR